VNFSTAEGESPLTTNAQLDFAVYLLRTEPYRGLSSLQQDTTPQAAAGDFEHDFERPSSYADELTRESQAAYIYENFIAKTSAFLVSASLVSTSGNCSDLSQ
jgi:hypothetical protein